MKIIQTNKKPISSKPMKVDIKRLTDMGLLPVKKLKNSTKNK
jgi:hypothetical protein